ncbi:MAG TPA: hypothetical protein VMX16_05375 [Terriglobia bacterium]|nr:hypothetical protein [Terriglobia bacterium]
MRPTSRQWLIASSAAVFICGLAFGQQVNLKDQSKSPAKGASGPQTQKTPDRKIPPKITLLEVTRVSTSGALKAAAATKQTDPTAKSHNLLEGVAASKPADANSGVVELQSAAPGSLSGGGPLVVPTKDSKDSLLKNIHGDVYGSTAAGVAGNNAEDGAVGATSKGGKTSVYVQTDHSQGQLLH